MSEDKPGFKETGGLTSASLREALSLKTGTSANLRAALNTPAPAAPSTPPAVKPTEKAPSTPAVASPIEKA